MCFLDYLKLYFSAVIILVCTRDSQSWDTDDVVCIQSGPCKCTSNNGDTIDLSPLSNTSQPLVASTNSRLYIYHPCWDLPLKSVIQNPCSTSFAMCYFVVEKPTKEIVDFSQVVNNKIKGTFEKLAMNAEAVLRPNSDKEIEIVYKNVQNSSSNIITTIVKLDCNKKIHNYELIIDESRPLEHVLTLSSQHACPKSLQYMSPVGILFLIIFTFIAIYFIGGILVLKFIRGATGIEMIPNHEFWCKVPYLVKDGFSFLTNCGRSKPDSYETI